jgi:pilus assembly protein FimV
MSMKMPRLILMTFVICPSLAWALGLGEIHLHSALDEPLRADIDLIATTPEELTSVHAALAPMDDFTRFGIDHPPFLATFQFQVAKAKDGRPVLRVSSTDSIPEPFVTFLVEVDWARGHLMREYTVLLDPPVYASGRQAEPPAPVAVPRSAPARASAAPPMPAPAAESPPPAAAGGSRPATYRVAAGDTLMKIARSLGADGRAAVDQTMLALFRENPEAFGGNVNVLRRGAILRVPGADQIAAAGERDAIAEIDRQMSAWRAGGAASGGHLRLVAPNAPGGGAGGAGGAKDTETATLRDRVKDLETQLASERRLLEVRNQELAALHAKLGVKTPAPTATPTPTPAAPPAAAPVPAATAPSAPPPAVAAVKPVAKPAPKAVVAPPAAPSGSWLDWLASNWWLPGGIVVALLGGLGFAAFKRRQGQQVDEFASIAAAHDATDVRERPSRIFGDRKSADDSFVVEESGEHKAPDFAPTGDTAEVPAPDDTMSSESAVNLDQGDPLAEADFHMAYGLYDQAADLVRIALDREPDRRDLRLKLLEIYFVWGNKDLFLQTAKSLYATRDRAPAGEWDKIVIMGKQICPDDPLFAKAEGGGRGAGALVDLNLEGGENHVDVDLFSEPAGEHGPLGHTAVKEGDDGAATSESPQLHADSGLDFVLDTPERGADESPTREMPPRDEPTVESEMMP